VGTVSPNHVLYFLRGSPTAFGTAAAPNDLGAYVNNLSENPVSEKDETMELEELKDKIFSIGKKVDNIADHTIPKPEDALLKAKTTIDNMAGEMKGKEAKIAELEAQIEALEKQVETLKGDKAEADNLRAQIEQEKKDTRWAAVKNLYTPGMFHKPEVEQELRKKCEADPIGFQLENVGNLARAPVGAAKAQGVSTAKGSVDNMGNDQKIDVRDQIGKWSASEGKMVSIRGE
jgi:TolA-binding protein